MHSFLTSSAALLLAAAMPLASAQTYTTCNPLSSTCPSDPGMGATVDTDFTAGASKDWSVAAGSISYGSNGAAFTVAKQGDAPTIETSAYFFFGTAEVTMQAAPGTGIVSSIVLESDDLDEVDWEALGGDTTQIETNYFGKGYTGSYNRATYVGVSSPQTTFHTYTVNWQRDSIQWLIDGAVVRTLTAAEAGDYFPQTPMRLRIGIWAGGDPSNAPGTIEWAGGQTNYAAGPFTMYLKSVKITNANPGSSYTYSGNSGSADSIKIDGASAPAPADTTTAAAPTSTHTSTSSSSSSSSSSSTSSTTSTILTSTSSASSTGADTTSAPSSTVSSTKSTAPSSTFSSISSSNPSAVTNPISGITSSNSTLPGSNSTTPSGSTSPKPSSSATIAPSAGAASQNGVASSVVALYCFLFAIVAYVL